MRDVPSIHPRRVGSGLATTIAAVAMAGSVLCLSAAGASFDASPERGAGIFEDVRPFVRGLHREALRRGATALAIDDAERERWHRIPPGRSFRLEGLPIDAARTLDLDLKTAAPAAADVRAVVVDAAGRERPIRRSGRSWSGEVVGDPESQVFLSDSPAGTFGWITTGDRMLVVSSGELGAGGATVVHDLGDPTVAAIAWKSFACDAESLGEAPTTPAGAPPQGGLAGGTCRVVQLAIDTDEEFLGLFGGSVEAAQAYLETLVAAADAIHGRDAGVRLQLVWSRLWEANDPWTATSTQEQLVEFREHWNGSMGGVFRDSAHLISGRDLGGGMAWIGGLCTSFSYGVSANLSGFFPTPMIDHALQNWDPYVFAHELGHTLGSRHTHDPLHYDPPLDDCWVDDAVGPCSMAWGGTIMSYCHQCSGGLSNIVLALHPEVSSRIAATVGGAACASDGPCVADCNGNGVSDEFDIASAESADCNGDGVPDECEADGDGDGLPDECDACPGDPTLGSSAPCGCGIAPIDCDGDGIVEACEGGAALLAGEAFPVPDGDAVGAGEQVLVEAAFTIAAVEVEIAGLVHDRIGDLSATLTHVESGRSAVLFSRVGRTGGGGGDNSNLDGDYVFADADSADLWEAADALNTNGVVPPGRYFASGPASPAMIPLDAVFGGHPAAGTWRLEIADESSGAAGVFTAWNLRLVDAAAGDPCVGCTADLDGGGSVDGEDLGILLIYWGSGQGTADLDGSGVVDAADMAIVLDQWGPCP